MKTEITLQGETTKILLIAENVHEQYFIEKNAIYNTAKDYNVEFRFEKYNVHTVGPLTYNHCIIISKNPDKINFGDFPSVDKEVEDGVNKLMETECQLEEAFIVIDELEKSNERLKYTIAMLILSFVATLVTIYLS